MHPTTFERVIRKLKQISRLQLKQVIRSQTVVFFQSHSSDVAIDHAEDLVEVDEATFAIWQAEEPEFPWPTSEFGFVRFSQQNRLLALRVGGKPVCYGWLAVRRSFELCELQGTCAFQEPVTWIWDCVTPPRYRGRGYYTRFLRAVRSEPNVRFVIFSRAENAWSIKGIQGAGFQRWGTVTSWYRGHRIKTLDPCARALTFSAARGTPPQKRLAAHFCAPCLGRTRYGHDRFPAGIKSRK